MRASPSFAARRATAAAAGLLLVLALALSGCSGSDQDARAQSRAASAGFNANDVAFARASVTLQRQAVAMAELAPHHTHDPAVLALAARVKATQTRWNGTIRGCLSRWGDEMPRSMMGSPADRRMMSGRGGMMDREDLAGLGERSGAGFDREFLALMRRHHLAMLDLARAERTGGLDVAAMMQAHRMQVVQGRQLEQMRRMMQR